MGLGTTRVEGPGYTNESHREEIASIYKRDEPNFASKALPVPLAAKLNLARWRITQGDRIVDDRPAQKRLPKSPWGFS